KRRTPKDAPYEGPTVALRSRLIRRMYHAEAVAASGPHQHQRIFTFRDVAELLFRVRRVLHWMAVYLHDDITLAQAGVIRRAARLDVGHNRTIHVRGQLQLVAHLRSQVGNPNTPAAFAMLLVGAVFSGALAVIQLFHGNWNAHVLAIAQHVERDF